MITWGNERRGELRAFEIISLLRRNWMVIRYASTNYWQEFSPHQLGMEMLISQKFLRLLDSRPFNIIMTLPKSLLLLCCSISVAGLEPVNQQLECLLPQLVYFMSNLPINAMLYERVHNSES